MDANKVVGVMESWSNGVMGLSSEVATYDSLGKALRNRKKGVALKVRIICSDIT